MATVHAFYEAIEANDGERIKALLAEDERLVESADTTPPPIHWAIFHDKPEIVELLLDHGADIERMDQDRQSTPLAYAIVYGRKDIIRLLVARGADLESEGRSGNMLDIAMKGAAGGYEQWGDELASREEFAEIVQLLQDVGAKPAA